MARPGAHPDVSGGSEAEGSAPVSPPGGATSENEAPGTGVVRPGTGVVRPTTGVVASTEGAAKATAAVPETPPEQPLEPIKVVLPVIPLKPAKQGFLDRLVAPKPKKEKKGKKKKGRDGEAAADVPVSPAVTPPATEEPAEEPEAPPVARATTAPATPPAAPSAPPKPAPSTPPKPAPAKRPPAPETPPPAAKPPAAPPAAPLPASPPTPPPSTQPAPPPPAKQPPARQQRPAPSAPPAPPRPEPRPQPGRPPAKPPAGPSARPPGGPPPSAPPPMPGAPAPARAPGRPGSPPHSGRHPEHPLARPLRSRLPLPIRRRPMDAYGDDWPVYEEPESTARRWVRWLVIGVAALMLGGGGGALAGALQPPDPTRWLAANMPATATGDALIPLDPDAARPTRNGLASRLTGLLADERLGSHVTASVVDVATGERLFGSGEASAAIPASNNKLLTAAAVLAARGPAYRIPTRVVAGAAPGEVVLIGSGDVTLATGEIGTYPGAGRLDLLAEQVRESLGGQNPTRVVVDSTLFPGPTYSPNWFPEDRGGGFIADITAVMTDGARRDPSRPARGYAARYPEPDLAAGHLFAKEFGLPASAVSRGKALPDAEQLGEVLSPPIGRLVEIMLIDSDNVLAEGLARQVAIARGEPASFIGAGRATRDVLGELGLPVSGLVVVDGSGLSHDNRASADLLTQILVLASSPDHPELRPIVSGLPVPGYSGTLDDRAGATSAVRAKTGTLTGVNTLAGLVVSADGRLLAFSVLADRTKGNARTVEAALDKIAAEIASCGCG